MEEMHIGGINERIPRGLGLPTLLTKARLIKSLATVTNSTFRPSPPPQKSGGGTDESSNPLISHWFLWKPATTLKLCGDLRQSHSLA